MFFHIMPKNKSSGMVALLPAIILSSILLIVVVGVSQEFLSMLWRVSLAQDKSQSLIIARSCLRQTLAKRIQDTSYAGDETIQIFQYECVIKPFITENFVQDISVSVVVGDAKSLGKAVFNPLNKGFSDEGVF